jgi:hypothetical protein
MFGVSFKNLVVAWMFLRRLNDLISAKTVVFSLLANGVLLLVNKARQFKFEKSMNTRPQVPFVFSKEDQARLLDLQKQINQRNDLNASIAVVLRLAIRVCPLDSTLNLKALELLEDDRRRADQKGPKKDVYRMSCMVTSKEQEKLDLLLSLISPILRPKIKRSALGRLVLKLTTSSLIILQTSREVFFDDLRRRDTEESKKPRRSTR